MAIIRLQSEYEKQNHLYYEFDSADKPLGEGGMGKVYKGKCVDERTGTFKLVAIKFMFSDLPDHVIERARREASIQLRNDNLIEMLGFIETSERNVIGEVVKRYHVVSELLEGVMLDDLLQGKVTDQNGVVIPFAEKLYRDYQNNPYQFAITIIRSILSGVMALHDAGYIHRDIDPTNIMITKKGHIKLIDFGIAKYINSLNTHDKALTTAGVFMGKPWYAAPELVLGDVKHQNVTTDIYAIGILFYQLYMGTRPFEGANHEVLDMQLHKRMPLNTIPSKKIRAIIAKATNKKQELRFQSAAEFRVEIDKLPPTSPKIISIKKYNQTRKWLSIGVGSLIIIAAIIWIVKGTREEGTTTDFSTPAIATTPKTEYSKAVEKLKSAETAHEGLKELNTLMEEGNYDATYLLSRLKFDGKTKKEYDNVPDSIWILQLASKIKANSQEAHLLLQKSVEINPNDCNSLYALGLDFLVGDRISLDPNTRDLQKSKKYLDRALEIATKDQNEQIIQSVKKIYKDYAKEFKNLE